MNSEGQKFFIEDDKFHKDSYIKIIEIRDNYAMLRFKAMIPFLKSVKELPNYLSNFKFITK